MTIYDHFINGKYTKPTAGNYFESENPYTGEVWAKIARGDASDVEKAVSSAHQACETDWADIKATE